MQNSDIADILNITARLMELHGENSFKARSFQSAAFRIDKMKEPLEGKSTEELESTEGIGQSLSRKITQILSTGTFPELETLYKNTPAGVLEMMEIKGIGPKKVAVLWKELGVESPGELLYACNENRLLALKGFGAKTQAQIIQSIEFKNATKGQFLYPDAEPSAHELMGLMKGLSGIENVTISGEFRRRCEIITSLEFVISPVSITTAFIHELQKEEIIHDYLNEESPRIHGHTKEGIPFTVHFCRKEEFVKTVWLTTGSSAHISKMEAQNSGLQQLLFSASDEEEIYTASGLHYGIPEMRESEHALSFIEELPLPQLVTSNDLVGILHNHSTWSDGINSLLEMAEGCRDLNKTYLGICDHSRSAVYANGLNIDRVRAQHLEIDQLNLQLAPFRIFKGIESDILTDGSLDYPDEILAEFDFVVASIHSGFRMDEQKATERLIKAISNPYTTILGHATGRLLLSRPGYPIDHKMVIDACAEYGVVLELNAHPYRLDVDWRWITYALSKNVMISINPDAHSVEGYKSLYYGVNAARKGGLPLEMTFNAKPLEFIEEWFATRRKRAGQF